jgi:hypothetical protein
VAFGSLAECSLSQNARANAVFPFAAGCRELQASSLCSPEQENAPDTRSFLPSKGREWVGLSFLFLFEKSSHGALLRRRVERINELPKSLGENFRAKFPIIGDPGRSNIMAKKPAPAFPQLPVHQSINIMKMNCLKRFQELVRCMKEPRPIFGGQRTEIFETYSTDPFHLRVFHERFGHVAQGRGRSVLRGEPGHTGASMHLYAEI